MIGWAIAEHMRTDLTEDALTMAMTLRGDRPAQVTFRSDRGNQDKFNRGSNTSAEITAFALKNGLTRSMGFAGIRGENAMADPLSRN